MTTPSTPRSSPEGRAPHQPCHLSSPSPPLAQLGFEGHWLIDGIDPTGYDVVVHTVSAVPRFILLHGFARAYRRRQAKGRQRPDVRERFGSAAKQRREEMGLTQEELADRAGTHRTYLSDVERGARNPNLVTIGKLAAALELAVSELFRRVERP